MSLVPQRMHEFTHQSDEGDSCKNVCNKPALYEHAQRPGPHGVKTFCMNFAAGKVYSVLVRLFYNFIHLSATRIHCGFYLRQ